MARRAASLLLLVGAALAAPRSVSVVQTARGTGDRLAPKGAVPFAPAGGAQGGLELRVDAATEFQEVLGFGGAFTESSALNMMKLNATNPALYDELMDAYFGKDGLGYSFGRVPMGSCDFSPYTPSWSYDDTKDDHNLTDFSLKYDEERRLPIIRDAVARLRAAGKSLKIFGSPWSAPGWMKQNGKMICGAGAVLEGCALKKDAKYHDAFARYFAKWANAYEATLGQKMWGITIMNEPQENLLTYEGQVFKPDTQRDFIKDHLGPVMQQEAPGVRIMILDHDKDKLPEWAETILGDPDAAKYVWGSAVHWYSGDHFDSVAAAHEAYPAFPILATEATVAKSRIETGVDNTTDGWEAGEHYAHDMIGDFNNWVAGFVDWNLALDTKGGPLHVNVEVIDMFGSDAAVLLDTNPPGKVYYQSFFHYIGHFSKFVPEGARRIAWELHNGDAPVAPSVCSVALEKKISHADCVEGESFGCVNGTFDMWTSGGCRGTFTCDGISGVKADTHTEDKQTVHCSPNATAPQLETTAFRVGSDVVVVILNTADAAVDYVVVDHGDAARLTIPPHGIQTLKYPVDGEA